MLLDDLHFGFGTKLPLILQTEAAECGLACLAMVAGYYRYSADLTALRKRFPSSLKGTTLAGIVKAAGQMNMATRALKLDLQQLHLLKLPCILHWDFNHFVVLKKVRKNRVFIHDPAHGERALDWSDVSISFTGVALELWPTPDFRPSAKRDSVRLRSLLGPVCGIWSSLSYISLFSLSLEVFALVSPFFLQLVIDNVLVSGDRDLLVTLAIAFGFLVVLQQLVGSFRSWAVLHLGTTVSFQWRANVFSHLLRLPVQYFEKRHLGDVVSRFGSIDLIQRTLTHTFLEAMLDGIMTVITLGMMLLYSPQLGVVAVGTVACYSCVRWVSYEPLKNATSEQIVHASKQHSHFLETIRGIKAIKLFQRLEERRATWLKILVDQVNSDLRTQKIRLVAQSLNGLLFGIENVVIVFWGAGFVLSGNFSVGALMAFIAYKNQFDSRAGELVDKALELKMLRLQGERLEDIILEDAEKHGVESKSGTEPSSASVCVTDLSFRYSEQEPLVLDGVSFDVAEGECLVIAGPSGGGKTTLANLLLGILPLSAGKIVVGGMDIRQCGIDEARKMIATVLQDDVLFAGSLRDNICFFDPGVDHDWVEHCARLACIASDIAAMPMGYNTLVGDMGTVLSGGQKQRILIARALYKRPRILLLDEATSHLDIYNERLVSQAIKSMSITRIIIAHRPETIASADRVLILEEGRISEKHLIAPHM